MPKHRELEKRPFAVLLLLTLSVVGNTPLFYKNIKTP